MVNIALTFLSERSSLLFVELFNAEESAGHANERVDTENDDMYLLLAAIGNGDSATAHLKSKQKVHNQADRHADGIQI